MDNYDVVIIGGGPIGIACGLEAKKKDLKYVIIEKGTIVNSLYHYPSNMQFFSSSDKLEIDQIPFISKEAKPKKEEALEYYRRIVTNHDLNIHLFEKVEKISPRESDKEFFTIKTSKDEYRSKQLIIATGFYDLPNILDIPGENLPKVRHYYDNPHYYSCQKLAVIGASNSAVDAALECWRKGAEVTMIIRAKEVGTRVKYWVRPDILNRIKEGSIKALYESTVKEVLEDKLIISTPGGIVEVENDYVLALTGYRPNFKFLEELGILLSEDELKKPYYNPETMETNVDGVYLAGVICGGMETHKWFIENSRIHAKKIIDAITA